MIPTRAESQAVEGTADCKLSPFHSAVLRSVLRSAPTDQQKLASVALFDVAGPCDDRGWVFTGRQSYAPQKKSVLATNNGGDRSLD